MEGTEAQHGPSPGVENGWRFPKNGTQWKKLQEKFGQDMPELSPKFSPLCANIL